MTSTDNTTTSARTLMVPTLIVSSTLLQPVIALSWTFKHPNGIYKPSQRLYSILTAFISYLTVSLSTLMSLQAHSQPPNQSHGL